MAISQPVVWEVRYTGLDTNGGGFRAGASGTDFSQQDTPQYAVTDGVTNGTSTITSATANFGADVVGNIVYVQGGTGSVAAARYEITSRTNATTIVVDRATGLTAGTGVTIRIGGAVQTPPAALASAVGGNIIFWKYNATPYTATSTTINAAGGVLGLVAGVDYSKNTFLCGYDTNRVLYNTDANRPRIVCDLAACAAVTLYAASRVLNVVIEGGTTSRASTTAYGIIALSSPNPSSTASNCKVSSYYYGLAIAGLAVGCYVSNCYYGIGSSQNYGCRAYDCVYGMVGGYSSSSSFVNCVAGRCTAGLGSVNGKALLVNCLAHDCQTSYQPTDHHFVLLNCVSISPSAAHLTGGGSQFVRKFAYFGAVAAPSAGNLTPASEFIALGSSPVLSTTSGSEDYRLNTLADGGGRLRGLGWNPWGDHYPDLGLVQANPNQNFAC